MASEAKGFSHTKPQKKTDADLFLITVLSGSSLPASIVL
jgi:hypothetical protein